MSRYPHPIVEFNGYVTTVVAYLILNATRLGISMGNQTTITANIATWNALWILYLSDATRTTTVNHSVHAQAHAWELLLSSIYKDIPNSTLTDTDRDTLNIHERDTTLTPVDVAPNAPNMDVISQIHESALLRFTNLLTPDTMAMPKGQKVSLEMRIAAPGLHTLAEILAGAPAAVTTQVSRFLYTAAFTDGDVGKAAYIRSCYVNTTGEKGPWSDFITLQIG